MADKFWNTVYPGAQDVVAANQPAVVDDSAPGAGDGDRSHSSQINTMATKAQALATKMGSNLKEPGTVLKRLDDIEARQVIAGAGLTGGGALIADVTLDVAANADGSILVHANDIQVGVLATDAQHGNRGGGGIHAAATGAVAGFMSAADKTKLDLYPGALAGNANKVVSVKADESALELTVNTASDEKVKISAADTTTNYLENKLAAGTNVTITKLNPAGNEQLSLAVNPTAAAPADVTKAAASVGASTELARADHKHDVSTAAPSSIAAANSEGAATSLARSDHVHNHGAQTDGSFHAVAVAGGANGFLSGADKTKLDGIAALAAALTAVAPVDVTKAVAAVGIATTAARSDHKHDVSVAAPSSVGTANAEGAATSLARSDHVHNHGAQTDGSFHAVAVAGGANGFLSGVDKTKLDGIAAGAAALTSDAPANVTKAAAVVGVGTTAAKSDHKHDVSTAAPSSVGAANAEGAATSLARSDHVHNHGAQTDGSMHAAVIAAGASGFMTGADKTKLDGIASGAAALTASAPANVTKAAAAVGVATDAARADHKHDISTAAPSSVGTANSEGAATSLARSDHVHNHGAQTDGSLHAVAVAGGANGFLSGADKTKLDLYPAVAGFAGKAGYFFMVNATEDGIELYDLVLPAPREDELSPSATVGGETTLTLGKAPAPSASAGSTFDLRVYRNGALLRYTVSVTPAIDEFTYNALAKNVIFSALVAGEWILASYNTLEA